MAELAVQEKKAEGEKGEQTARFNITYTLLCLLHLHLRLLLFAASSSLYGCLLVFCYTFNHNHVCTYACVSGCMHVYMYVVAFVHEYKYVYMYACMCVLRM